MSCGPDGKGYRRINAIHLLLLGVPYPLVLRNNPVSDRSLRLWISRFNQQGIDGLIYRPPSRKTAFIGRRNGPRRNSASGRRSFKSMLASLDRPVKHSGRLRAEKVPAADGFWFAE